MTTDAGAGPWGPVLVLFVASLVPLAIVGLTSFAKTVVVLGILRHALGTPQVPPSVVVTTVALILSLVVMAPLWHDVDQRAAEQLGDTSWPALWAAQPQRAWAVASEAGQGPLFDFLRRNASVENVQFFERMTHQGRRAEPAEPADFLVLAPAFVVTELTEGFLVGFLLFLPFLVVDLLVANLLLALGLQMISPATVSLPLKLLLFVLADGWALVCHGLVTGYH